MTTTPEQRIAIVRDYLDHVLNGHDASAAADFFTADAEWHGGSLGTVKGSQNIVGLMGALIGGLPDIQATAQDVIASGDLVAMRFVATGTQTGDLLGIPKTGKSVKWDSVDIYKVTDDGKISAQWSFQDMAAIMSQLGAVKLPLGGLTPSVAALATPVRRPESGPPGPVLQPRVARWAGSVDFPPAAVRIGTTTQPTGSAAARM